MSFAKMGHFDSYNVEIDKIDRNKWAELLMAFDDASLYQTWSMGAVRAREENLSHLILTKEKEVVGLCQVVISRVSMMGSGIADVNRGPLWRKLGCQADIEHLILLLEALRNEYAVKRGFLLRVWPNEIENGKNNVRSVLERMGFNYNATTPGLRTLRLEITPPLEELRKNFLQKWRNQLNRAEKNNLKVIEGSSGDLFEIFLDLSKQMLNRKEFEPGVDYKQFQIIQNNLEEQLKMMIMVCESEGEPVAVTICSAIGDTGIYLLGASGDKGIKLNGSNLLQWRMIQWLKQRGVRYYDLGGIDPENNPGVYHFKCGVAGKTGKDERYVGGFTTYNNAKASLLNVIVNKTRGFREKVKNRIYLKNILKTNNF